MDLGPYSWTFNTMPHVYYTCIYIAQVCSWETTDIPVFICILIDLISFERRAICHNCCYLLKYGQPGLFNLN